MHIHFNRGAKILIIGILMIQGCATTTNASKSPVVDASTEQKNIALTTAAAPAAKGDDGQAVVALDWDQYLIYDPAAPMTGEAANHEAIATEQKPMIPSTQSAQAMEQKVSAPNSAERPEVAPMSVAEGEVPNGIPSTAIVRIPGKLSPQVPSQEAQTTDYLTGLEHLGEKPSNADLDISSRPPDVRSMPVGLEASPDLLDEKGTYRVKIPQLNARSGPSMQAAVVRTLDKGQIINGTGREGIWIHTAENDYVSIIFLTKVSSN